MAWILDPDPNDPPLRHTEASGASLAVTVAAFERVGGIPPVPSGEDRAFVDALQRIDARIRHDPAIQRDRLRPGSWVARRAAWRMPSVAAWCARTNSPTIRLSQRTTRSTPRLTPSRPLGLVAASSPSLAAGLGLDPLRLAEPSATCFGAAWAELESLSPVLRRGAYGSSTCRPKSRRRTGCCVWLTSRRRGGGLTMPPTADLLESVPWMQSRAEALDRDAAFPAEEMDRLSRIGALTLPLPVRSHTKQGDVRDDALADQMLEVLTLAGRGNLSVGRILEAHINALHLIGRYGSASSGRRLRTLTRAPVRALGYRSAHWRAPDADVRAGNQPDRLQTVLFRGRPRDAGVVTAQEPTGRRGCWCWAAIGRAVKSTGFSLQGMRAAVTGAVDFTGCETAADRCWGRQVIICENRICPLARGADQRWRWAD